MSFVPDFVHHDSPFDTASVALDGKQGRQVDSRMQSTSMRQSHAWPTIDTVPEQKSEHKSEKKRGGFAKIWRIISWNKSDVALNTRQRSNKADDDGPLAPPPPLSYLVDRGPGDLNLNTPRHSSTPSLLSTASPRNPLSSPAMSPMTAPSSLIPSPVSSRPSGPERKAGEDLEHVEANDAGRIALSKNLHSIPSDNDTRLL